MILLGDLSTHRCKGDGFTEVYTVSFFGHRQIHDIFAIEETLEQQIRSILRTKEYVDFLVGRNGEFDQLVSSAVRRIKRTYRGDNSSLCLILPYATAEYLNNRESFEGYYDSIEITGKAANAHPKSAIQIRNREMADRADLIICCIEHESGGAFQTVLYAKKQGKRICNSLNEPSC